jgi:predicted MPP superfamily phosphohydrolase
MYGLGAFAAGMIGLGGYAVAVEPMRLTVTRYAFTPPQWPKGLRLSIAVLADIHACLPWMTPDRIRHIARTTNDLGPDVIVLLGDYVVANRFSFGAVDIGSWAGALATLSAPLGVHAVLGNHDWWSDKAAQRRGGGPTLVATGLAAQGISVYENRAARLQKEGHDFWLAGLADQMAIRTSLKRYRGLHDLPGTLAQVRDAAPIILLAHEPDIFARVPDRVALTLAGHTHGGQVRILGYSPVVPSRYGNRYAYGHVVEGDRHLIVSGGLGCSKLPLRVGVPPEIVMVDLGGAP